MQNFVTLAKDSDRYLVLAHFKIVLLPGWTQFGAPSGNSHYSARTGCKLCPLKVVVSAYLRLHDRYDKRQSLSTSHFG